MSPSELLTPVAIPAELLVDVPRDWEQVQHPDADLCLREGPEAWDTVGFRANLVVTSGAVDATLMDWQVAVEDELDATLDAYYLIDFDVLPLAGGEGTYRLACYSHDGVPVTLLQWSRLAHGEVVCLTFTVATAAYDDMADDLGKVVSTLRHGDQEAQQ